LTKSHAERFLEAVQCKAINIIKQSKEALKIESHKLNFLLLQSAFTRKHFEISLIIV